jgi:hypothetical protein
MLPLDAVADVPTNRRADDHPLGLDNGDGLDVFHRLPLR